MRRTVIAFLVLSLVGAGLWYSVLPGVGTAAEPPAAKQKNGARNDDRCDSGKSEEPDQSEGGLKESGPNVWLDKNSKQRRVVLKGEVVLREGALEMLICLKGTKEHESILAVDTQAQLVHAALVLAGAEPGKPVQFEPEYQPASGQQIDILLEWRDAKGQTEQAPAQSWVRNFDTGEELATSWVFGGSGFETNPETGETFYLAEDGDLVCVANFPSAMLDLPIESSQSDDDLLFVPYTERIPPLGTPVTIYLMPVLKNEKADEKPASGQK